MTDTGDRALRGQKQGIRDAMLARRRSLHAREAQKLSRAAQECLLAAPAWRAADIVALYWPVRGETDTRILLDNALRQGKTVLLPRVLSQQEGGMRFFPYADARTLVLGSYGIMEPDMALAPPPPQGDEWLPQLAVVPGMAFDPRGFRLGSGAGYYDRFFARHAAAGTCRAGFAYAFQMVEKLPVAPWDVPMHVLVSENGARPVLDA